MSIFLRAWNKIARFPVWAQIILKSAIFVVVLIIVLFPNPILLVKQIYTYTHLDSLIQTTFPEMEHINQELDAILPSNATRQQEFQMIQRYVYQHIPYMYDWHNWGNADFWPTAEQVWQRQREDCDGQAVLAASILRARGFESARLMGNIRHIWVAVDEEELMSPDREQTVIYEEGKIRINWPSRELLFGALAIYFGDFPGIRHVILLFTLLGLCYHPGSSFSRFLGLAIMALIGLIVLQDWARQTLQTRAGTIDIHFVGGSLLLCGAIFLAVIMKKRVQPDREHTVGDV